MESTKIVQDKLFEETTIEKFTLSVNKNASKLLSGLLIANIKVYVRTMDIDKISSIINRDYQNYIKKNSYLPEFKFMSLVYDYDRKIRSYFNENGLSIDKVELLVDASLSIVKVLGGEYIFFKVCVNNNGKIIKI